MRVMSVTLLTMLLVSGCAGRYNQALKAGAEAASVGEWEQAIAHYEAAREIKPSESVDAKVEEARANAVEAAMITARSALREGDFETVVDRLRFALTHDGDRVEISSLKREVESSLIGRATRSLSGGYSDTAYLTAMRHKVLFPGSSEGDELLERVRAHYVAEAEAHRKAGRYEEAMTALQAILTHEPDQRADLSGLLDEVKSSWAVQLSGEAAAHERAGRLGQATVSYALAYAMNGVEADRSEARRLAERLRGVGAFTVDLQIQGNRTRTRAFTAALEGAGEILPELSLGSEDHDLRLWVNTPDVRCSERAETQKKRRDYVAGQIDVPNPDRERVDRELAEAQGAHDRADAQATAVWPRIERLRERLDGLGREATEAERMRAEAQRKESMAQDQLNAANQALEERRAALSAASGDEAERTHAQEAVASAERNVADWQEAVAEARAERERADTRYDEAAQARDPVQAELDELNDHYEGLLRLRDVHKSTRTSLMADIRNTPETIRQDVNEVHAYDEKHWTRTCDARTYATAAPRWSSSIETKQQYARAKSTEDVEHRGHEASGLREDPKEYPLTDAQLITQSDEETFAEILTWLSTYADERYDTQRQLLLDDPLSTEGLSLYLGASGRLEEAHRNAVRVAARERGIEDLDAILTPGR